MLHSCNSSINVAYNRNFIVENHIFTKEATRRKSRGRSTRTHTNYSECKRFDKKWEINHHLRIITSDFFSQFFSLNLLYFSVLACMLLCSSDTLFLLFAFLFVCLFVRYVLLHIYWSELKPVSEERKERMRKKKQQPMANNCFYVPFPFYFPGILFYWKAVV